MSRRCSHCGNNGHNSRTCMDSTAAAGGGSGGNGGGGFKLFGVRFSPEPTISSSPVAAIAPVPPPVDCSSTSSSSFQQNLMRKSVSMGNLSNYGSTDAGASPPNFSPNDHHDLGDDGVGVEGYASDDLVHTNSSSRERKKGVAWTEEEHRAFLMGLQKLGKGDWRGISRKFVKTRTPTQVASHAQKYFLRRNNLNKRRRRSSLFDITADLVPTLIEEPLLEETASEDADVCPELTLGQSITYGNEHGKEMTQLSLRGCSFGNFSAPTHMPQFMPLTLMVSEPNECMGKVKDMEMKETEAVAKEENLSMHPSVDLADNTGSEVEQTTVRFIPFIPMWPVPSMSQDAWITNSKVVKPTPVVPRPPPRVDEAMQESDQTNNSVRPVMEPTPLSYRLLEEGSRHSAFHTASPNPSNREIDGKGSLTNAISVP